MDAKWMVIGFGHCAECVRYQWTYSAVNVTGELTPGELEQIATWAKSRDVWFHPDHALFLCADAAEQITVTDALDSQDHEYAVEASDLTAEDRSIIKRSQISNRNDIAGLLDAPKNIHWATVTAVDTSVARGITVQRGSRTTECYGCIVPGVGDKVLVAFVDGDAEKPCVIGKVLGV